MENLQMLLYGFSNLFTLENTLVTCLGCILGLIVGAMPGIGSLAGCALLLPLTYNFNPTTAIVMLAAVYYSNMFGGSYSAILLNIPGDSPAIMTTMDGYPLARSGHAGKALLTANISSFIGGMIGMLILTFMGPFLSSFGLKFGAAEMTCLLLLAMTSISWLVGENPIKGLVSTLLGAILTTVGMDAVYGSSRFNLGNSYLLGGIPFTPLVIGAVGFSQVLSMAFDRSESTQLLGEKISWKRSLFTRHEWRRILAVTLRSGVLGCFIGVLPGAGATIASVTCYAVQKKGFKSEVPLGEGAIEGIASCEAANNSAAAGSFAPLLALGIPGSGTGAILLGGLVMWGLTPGPLLFTSNPDFAWGTIASLFFANIVALFIGLLGLPLLCKLITIPNRMLCPIITVICIIGSYSTNRSMYGVIVMLTAGVICYILIKYKYPMPPLLLAFVLTPLMETKMRMAFLTSAGDPRIFVSSPICIIFLAAFCVFLLTPIVKGVLAKVKKRQ